jgi:hypothetical protein
VPRSLYSSGKFALVSCTCTRLAAWADFTVFSNKAAEHIASFVIDNYVFICTKLADFWPGDISSPNWLFGFNVRVL